MQLSPYLLFNGQCEEAFKFYEACGVGKIDGLLKHAGTPAEEHVPAEWREKIMHGRLLIGDDVLMASDSPPEYQKKQQGFYVSLQFKEVAEGERIFNALAEGGEIAMPFGKTFWAAGFGMCTDQFGIPWMVNCEEPH
jgi:PhnB protein